MSYLTRVRQLAQPSVLRTVPQTLRERLGSSEEAYVLRRDLDAPHVAPAAKIEISVRPLVEADVPKVFGEDSGLPSEYMFQVRRRRLLESGIGTCYAAVAADDEPCYVQWLMGAEENARIRDYYGGSFPEVEPGTMLLEGAFTPTAFRGKGIMGAAMSLIAEKAADTGSRYVITVVDVDNIPSLRGCEKANFFPHQRRTLTWRLFRRDVRFEILSVADRS